MVFEVYVAGPLEEDHERRQMDEIIRALHAIFGPRNDVARLIVDIDWDTPNGVSKQIDGLLVTEGRLFILELKSISCNRLTVQYDPELQSLSSPSIRREEYNRRQSKWLIDGVASERMKENPIDQVAGQRRALNQLIRERVKNSAGDQVRLGTTPEDRGTSPSWDKRESPTYQLGRAIRGYIVIRKGEIVYGSAEAENYVRSQPWLSIVDLETLVDRIRFATVARPGGRPLLTDEELGRLLAIVGAEKRAYHRWITTPLQHEYTEISRVPYLDFLFDSETPDNLMRAIAGADQFRLRAYAKDIADVFFRADDEQTRVKALIVLANWGYPLLGGLLVYALRKSAPPSLLRTAINVLQEEHAYHETLPALVELMDYFYESATDSYLTLPVIKAMGNLGRKDAGKAIHDLLLRSVGEDYYGTLVSEARNDDSERRASFGLEVLSKALEGMAACRYRESSGLVRRLLVEFPVDRYVSLLRTIHGRENRSELLVNSRILLALETVLRHIEPHIRDIWDGRGESEVIKKIDDIYQRVLREGDDILGPIALYGSYLKVTVGIASSEGLSMLVRHLDSLPPLVSGSKWRYRSVRQRIIEAIGDMRSKESYDFIAAKLQNYKHEARLFDQEIIAILNSLGRSGDPRYVGAISTVLEINDTGLDGESVQHLRHHAAVALEELGGRESFEVLMQLFLREPSLAFEPVRRLLYNLSPSVRNELAKRAESLLLPKCREKIRLPGSYEAYLLADVASEESLEFLFELARDSVWYLDPLPQRIMDFAHIDWVRAELLKMLDSKDDHQRAFAIDMITGSGCLGEKADEVLSKFNADPSPLVRCSFIDFYFYVEKDNVTVARFLDDPAPKVRAHAAERLLMTPHRGAQRCLVVSNAGWQGVQRVIYNDGGIFFLEETEHGSVHPESLEDAESFEPFFIAADRMALMFMYRKDVKVAGHGSVAVRGLYMEEKGEDGVRLLVLPLRGRHDELELLGWGDGGTWLDDMVSTFHGATEGDQADLRKADELLLLVDEKIVFPTL